ncbi:MAG TPA: neutral/alkaline non-lysosomal ceramidase N-terminal domain-containing protein [Conexibacter sp.]
MQAGVAKVEISASPSVVGAEMAGYGKRRGGAVSVHDPLFVRALVLEHDHAPLAICSVDLCHVGEDVVADARERIAHETRIAPERVFVSASHTHSAPLDIAGWPDGGLAGFIAAAVARASERLQPARAGVGWGMLHGHAVNRRRLEDPVDPAVFVIRIDAADGAPLGLYYAHGCHPVVLGSDNREVSGDWPSHSSRVVEAHLGADAVALFGQGSSGDVNPLTEGMRERFARARRTLGLAEAAVYYESDGAGEDFHADDRVGGAFAEVEQIGDAVAEEVMRVARGIATQDVSRLWTRQLPVAGGVITSDPPSGLPRPRVAPGQPLELMLVGIDGPDAILVGVPGEVFGETGVSLRHDLRAAGVRHPFVVTQANGRRGYLPPRHAFPDGGYEVVWARSMGFTERLQDDIRSAVLDAVRALPASGEPSVPRVR